MYGFIWICIKQWQLGWYIMDDNKAIFETIIDVLRKANIGFSINEVKDILIDQNKNDQKPKTDDQEYNPPKKYDD